MGGILGTSDLDLGKKVGNLDFWDAGGYSGNFGFGLRKKSWKFAFLGLGGYSGTLALDLGKKVGSLHFWDRGYSGNFGFGLKKKSWKFGFLGWGGGYSGKVMKKIAP